MEVKKMVQQMMSAGVHFGHKKKNSKMIPYIYTEKDDLQILDLLQTYKYLKNASQFLFDACQNGQQVLFVGTKKHIAKCVEQRAIECNSWYINKRWLGGLLTNLSMMSLNFSETKISQVLTNRPEGSLHPFGVQRDLRDPRPFVAYPPSQKGLKKSGQGRAPTASNLALHRVQRLANAGTRSALPAEVSLLRGSGTPTKKEVARMERRKKRLQKYLGGVQTMSKLPDIVIIIGQQKEINAVRECQKCKIPNLTILDTNCDPSLTDLFIPANDDSLASVNFILNQLSKAIKEGKKKYQKKYVK